MQLRLATIPSIELIFLINPQILSARRYLKLRESVPHSPRGANGITTHSAVDVSSTDETRLQVGYVSPIIAVT